MHFPSQRIPSFSPCSGLVLNLGKSRDHQPDSRNSNYQEDKLWKTQRESKFEHTSYRVVQVSADAGDESSNEAGANED